MTNVLFICSQNQWRSLTAEHVFQRRQDLAVRSAGTASTARIRVSAKDISWADIIFVMENKHREIVQQRFPFELKGKKLICLHVPDHYHYMDEELVALLEDKVGEHM